MVLSREDVPLIVGEDVRTVQGAEAGRPGEELACWKGSTRGSATGDGPASPSASASAFRFDGRPRRQLIPRSHCSELRRLTAGRHGPTRYD
jgi:hypothetical protein